VGETFDVESDPIGALTGITMVKRFTYRGDTEEEWSNKYHFRSAPPSTSADWMTLFSALADIERTVYPATTHLVAAYGYNTDDAKPQSVWSIDLDSQGTPLPGLFVPAGTDDPLAGDQAYFAEWTIDKRSSKGKPIYLRKYLHGGQCDGVDPDIPGSHYRGVVDTYAHALGSTTGGFHGGLRSRTSDAPILWTGTSDYITTRTLRRRGKRPLGHP
jgi:hypothetical protein